MKTGTARLLRLRHRLGGVATGLLMLPALGWAWLTAGDPLPALAEFVLANAPTPAVLARGGPPALAWAACCLAVAGWLKTRRGWRTGYTRKLFHFLTFGTVVAAHRLWGAPGVCLFGAAVTLVLAYALARGEGHSLYEALAREKDAPRRTAYIVMPYVATLLGGVLANVYIPQTAVLGYLVAGLGDAVAEPVGVRFGRHRYRVPSYGGIPSERSWEGSAAVFAASALALALALAAPPFGLPAWRAAAAAAGIALASAAAEALSPHGWDNAVLQVLPAGLGALLVGT